MCLGNAIADAHLEVELRTQIVESRRNTRIGQQFESLLVHSVANGQSNTIRPGHGAWSGTRFERLFARAAALLVELARLLVATVPHEPIHAGQSGRKWS